MEKDWLGIGTVKKLVNSVRAAILILLFATVNNASAAYGHRPSVRPTPTPAPTNRGAMRQIQANALASNNIIFGTRY